MRKMKKNCCFVIMVGIFILSSCKANNLSNPKEVIDNGTNVEATLYTLEEQKEVLKDYAEFFSLTYLNSNTEKYKGTYIIPGLIKTETLALNKIGKPSESRTMDPQGITVADDYILISAYSYDKKHNSVIYVLDKKTHEYVKTIVLKDKPHVGGITYDIKSKNIWVCAVSKDKKAQIVSISLKDIENYQISPDFKPINYQQEIDLKDIKRASYITYYDNGLFVGYFSEKNEAILEKYNMTDNGDFIEEIRHRTILTSKNENATPDEIGKVTHGIQGITIYNDYILLSQSYGTKNSKIRIYKNINSEKVFLDDELIKEIEAPPYLEQITIDNNQLYTIFESATERFRENSNIVKVDRVIKLNLSLIEQFK